MFTADWLTALKRKWPFADRGQGLVEYALILVLVAIVVILVVGLLGDEIKGVFCNVVAELGDNPPDIAACQPAPPEAPPEEEEEEEERSEVICMGVSNGQTVSGSIVFEAVINDVQGLGTNYVDIFVDGLRDPFNPAGGRREWVYHYCLRGPDSGCTGFDTHALSNGSHTIRAVAYWGDGTTAECSVTFNVDN